MVLNRINRLPGASQPMSTMVPNTFLLTTVPSLQDLITWCLVGNGKVFTVAFGKRQTVTVRTKDPPPHISFLTERLYILGDASQASKSK